MVSTDDLYCRMHCNANAKQLYKKLSTKPPRSLCTINLNMLIYKCAIDNNSQPRIIRIAYGSNGDRHITSHQCALSTTSLPICMLYNYNAVNYYPQ